MTIENNNDRADNQFRPSKIDIAVRVMEIFFAGLWQVTKWSVFVMFRLATFALGMFIGYRAVRR